jgi:hypothetical protein
VIRAHYSAVRALVAALEAAPTSLLVFDGAVDGEDVGLAPQQPERTPYVVLRPGRSPQVNDERLAPWSRRFDGRVYVTCVGATWDEAAWALEQTRGVLLDVVPVVAGRSVAPLALFDSSPIEVDRDTAPPLFVGVDLYSLFSV